MSRDPDEIEVWCRKCNGYLYSIGPAELAALAPSEHDVVSPGTIMVDCPMLKGENGSCTGRPSF